MSPLHSFESLQVCSFQTCVWNQNGTKAPLNAANKTAQIVIYLQIRGSNAGFVFTSTTLNLNVRIYTKYNQIKENGLLNGYQHRWLKSMQPTGDLQRRVSSLVAFKRSAVDSVSQHPSGWLTCSGCEDPHWSALMCWSIFSVGAPQLTRLNKVMKLVDGMESLRHLVVYTNFSFSC